MEELLAQFFLAAVAQHHERELAAMWARHAAAMEKRQREWAEQTARENRYVDGLKLTAPSHVTQIEGDRALRHIAPYLGEHEIRGAVDGYELARRPSCSTCGARLDPNRDLNWKNPTAN